MFVFFHHLRVNVLDCHQDVDLALMNVKAPDLVLVQTLDLVLVQILDLAHPAKVKCSFNCVKMFLSARFKISYLL